MGYFYGFLALTLYGEEQREQNISVCVPTIPLKAWKIQVKKSAAEKPRDSIQK